MEAKRATLKRLARQFKDKRSRRHKSVEAILNLYKTDIQGLYLKQKATLTELAALLKQMDVEAFAKTITCFYRGCIQKLKIQRIAKKANVYQE